MSHFDKLSVLVCAVLLSTDVARGRYSYRREMNGWVKVHKVVATWDDAVTQCHKEGAVLMSPVREELLGTMLSIIEESTSYFIGMKATIYPGLYVSLEGVPLDDMPVSYMYSQLDPQLGDCLSMDREHVRVVSCTARLPFVCYKENNSGQNMTECGTFDKAYKLEHSTGSCYKFHTTYENWKNAYAICITEGGYLAVVDNNAEAQTLLKIIVQKDRYVSVGLRDWYGNGNWTSIHGDPVQQIYNKWENDKVPAKPCCEVGVMHPTTGLLRSFNVRTLGTFYMCEKDPNHVPFPFTE